MREAIRARVRSFGHSVRDFGERAAPALQKGLKYGLAAATAAATVAKVAHDIHQGAVRGGGGGGGPRLFDTAPASPDFMYHGIRYGDALAGYDAAAARGEPSGAPSGGGGWHMAEDGRWRLEQQNIAKGLAPHSESVHSTYVDA